MSNEETDVLGKSGASKESGGGTTECGIRQWIRKIHPEDRNASRVRCLAGWSRHVGSFYLIPFKD